MSVEPDMDLSGDVRVKEELLEVGPTVIQERNIDYCVPTSTKVDFGEDIDWSKPISSSTIIFDDDSDMDSDSDTSDIKLLAAECVPVKSTSVEECLGDETGSQHVADVQTCIKEELSQWERGRIHALSDEREQAEASPERSAAPHAAADAGRAPGAAVGGGARYCSATPPRGSTHPDAADKRKTTNVTPERCKILFKCDICNAKFTKAGSLKHHKRSHTGERPYKCEICNADFTQAGHRNKHKRIHTGERPYECEICNAKFTNGSDLNRHKRIHTGERPYECEICNAKFTRAGSLNRHKRIHTCERPYECEICNAKFTRAGSLNTHKRIHTGERPYECEIWAQPALPPLTIECELEEVDRLVLDRAAQLASPPPAAAGSSSALPRSSPRSSPLFSPRSSADEYWSLGSCGPRSRAEPYARSLDDRRSRKKEQNKNAVTRYRQKKKAEIEVLLSEERSLRGRHTELGNKCAVLQREIRYLKGLMRDLFKA